MFASSPRLIAGFHVLHRPTLPRHPHMCSYVTNERHQAALRRLCQTTAQVMLHGTSSAILFFKFLTNIRLRAYCATYYIVYAQCALRWIVCLLFYIPTKSVNIWKSNKKTAIRRLHKPIKLALAACPLSRYVIHVHKLFLSLTKLKIDVNPLTKPADASL